MAKRFTDTDKWKKKFIRSLEAPYKLLWLYILDECDHAGVWIVDFEVARLRLGEGVDEETAKQVFGEKILPLDDGDKWLILDFIEFQYGSLKEENRAHQSVISILKRYGFWSEEEKTIQKNKPLTSPLQGAKDKDKDKEKDKEKDKDKDIYADFSFCENGFMEVWGEYKKMRLKIKKPLTEYAEILALTELDKLSGSAKDRAIKIVNQSIKNSWQGLFELKNEPLKPLKNADRNAKYNDPRLL